jgi:N-acetylmuramoyl-L-alanine amidase
MRVDQRSSEQRFWGFGANLALNSTIARKSLSACLACAKYPKMSRICRVVAAAVLSLWWAGCETTSPRPMAVAITTVNVPEPIRVAPAAPITDTVEPPPPRPTIIATNIPPAKVVQTWPTNWNNVWIPLETWGRYNGMGRMTQHGSNITPAYELQTSNAVMSVRMGSKIARCNGLECWLGYTPQMIKGLPYIHSLDAQKNLQPLVTPPAYEFKTERTIAIDAGHGGSDSGAKSALNDHFEKEYTLDWALRLAPLLSSKGWRVVLTRTNDIYLSLPDRVAIADRYQADLFVSLHFNSGVPNRELAGVETYCLTPVGMPSNLVRTFADDVKQSFPNNAFDDQNYQIAYRVHRELVQSLSTVDRGLRRARFMTVLRGQNRPAVLIEAAYLSTPNEAKKIATAAYRQSLAEAVARALE